jgi:hypothetical protein
LGTKLANKLMTKTSKIALSVLTAGAVALALAPTAQAVPITGSVTFGGNVSLDTSSAGTATKVTAWSGPGGVGTPYVSDSSGNFAATALTTSAIFTAPWSFSSPLGLANLWHYTALNGDTYTFNLTSSAIFSQGGSPASVVVKGSGTVTATGPVAFDPTAGSWNFQTGDPSAGSPPVFSFAAQTGTVPDGGTTAMLLGFALCGLGLLKRKFSA